MTRQIVYKAFILLSSISIAFIPILHVARHFLFIWALFAILYLILFKKLTLDAFSLNWLLLPFFYIIHALSLIYTNNLHSGIFDLEVKLSFIAIPFLFYLWSKEIDKVLIKKLENIYLYTILTLLVLLIIRAIYLFLKTHKNQYFYYNDLSFIYHPSYLALYITLAVIFVLNKIANSDNKLTSNILNSFILVFLLIFLYFLSSKAGIIITSIVIFLHVLFKLSFIRRIYIKIIIINILIGAIFSIFSLKFNSRFYSVESSIKNANKNVETSESTASRILVWEAGISLIKQNWLLGVGCGDVNDILVSEYIKRNMTGAIEKRLNLHNQFLETWLSLGIIGILYLIFLLIYPAYLAWKNKKISWLLFIIAVSLNFLFETMLNTQAGVIFISYFYYFFFIELKTEVK